MIFVILFLYLIDTLQLLILKLYKSKKNLKIIWYTVLYVKTYGYQTLKVLVNFWTIEFYRFQLKKLINFSSSSSIILCRTISNWMHAHIWSLMDIYTQFIPPSIWFCKVVLLQAKNSNFQTILVDIMSL